MSYHLVPMCWVGFGFFYISPMKSIECSTPVAVDRAVAISRIEAMSSNDSLRVDLVPGHPSDHVGAIRESAS